jgi:hypothetical protein
MDDDSKHHGVWWRLTARDALFVVSLNTAGFILLVLGQLILYGWPEDGARRMLSIFVFSNCTLTMVGLVLLRVAPRLADQRYYVRWLLLISMMAGSAVLGFCLSVLILTTLEIRPRDYRSWVELPEDLLFSLLLTFAFGISGYLYEIVRARLDTATIRLRTALSSKRSERVSLLPRPASRLWNRASIPISSSTH